MPDGIVLFQVPFGNGWAILQDTVAATLDREIRAVGWHFMWLIDSTSRRGLGRTDESAIRSALMRALEHVRGRFNAAELDSVSISKYLGFRVARVRLLARHIQQKAGLDSFKEIAPQGTTTV